MVSFDCHYTPMCVCVCVCAMLSLNVLPKYAYPFVINIKWSVRYRFVQCRLHVSFVHVGHDM